ncbi:MAG TPA: type I phosphomannose isomerase catalytic subunit [Terriglobia bacterium]|nr:type I phosphomannose isomerase catalytic subunit [Terriglobia bacterium]
MPKLNAPLKLSPVLKPKIWGKSDLSPLFDGPVCESAVKPGSSVEPEPIGEAWLTGEESRFLSGPVAGMTLGEASEKFRSELHGSSWKGRRFPILAKFIFTSDWLSVQVHPDDRYAKAHEPGSVGKCETWYIVQSDPKAEILLGLKPNTTLEMLRTACEKGASKGLFHRFHPKAGEGVFVPPGTPHALGPGLVLFEAQENSDITYRLDDFGRLGLDGKPRPLHLEKGLAVTKPELPPHRNLPRVVLREPFGFRRFVVASRYFAVEELTLEKTAHFKAAPERVETLAILAGEGRVETPSGWLGYRTGDAWVVPPAAGQYRLSPVEKTRLLKFYVPDVERDFRRLRSRRGFKAALVAKILFD